MTTDRDILTSLVAAREYIVQNGWITGKPLAVTGEACVKGALWKVSNRMWNIAAEEELALAIEPEIASIIKSEIASIIKSGTTLDSDIYSSRVVTDFNDRYCKSEGEALALFDKAINNVEDRIANTPVEELISA